MLLICVLHTLKKNKIIDNYNLLNVAKEIKQFCVNINYLSQYMRKKKLSIFVEEFVVEWDKFKSYNVETLIDSKGIKHIIALMFDCKSMQDPLSIFIVCDFYLVVNISREYCTWWGLFFCLRCSMHLRHTAVRNPNPLNLSN